MAPKSLTPAQAGRLAKAALDNAQALIDEAELLLAADRHPRALVLAVLAGEEFGKAITCASVFILNPDDAPGWKQFWDQWRRHDWKLERALGELADMMVFRTSGTDVGATDALWERLWAEVPEGARNWNQWKQGGLYVDFRNGEVSVPREVIDADKAHRVVEAIGAVIRDFTGRFRAANVQELFERVGPQISDLMATLLEGRETGDWGASRVALEDFLRRHAPTDDDLERQRRIQGLFGDATTSDSNPECR